MYNFYRYPYSRNNSQNIHPCPPPSQNEKISPPAIVPPKKKKCKKIDIKEFKKNTCKSLNDVEHFLCDFNSFIKYIKLYKLLKK